MKWEWLLPTCCFIRNTCSSSAFISLSCTSCTEQRRTNKREHFRFTQHLDKTRYTTSHLLSHRTFLIGGFVMKSSNGSSGLTVVKFSCKIAIFFSLSHPDGLEENNRHLFIYCNTNRRASTTIALAPLTWTLRPSPPLRPTWWTESHTSCVLNICRADPCSSPLSPRYRWGQRHL